MPTSKGFSLRGHRLKAEQQLRQLSNIRRNRRAPSRVSGFCALLNIWRLSWKIANYWLMDREHIQSSHICLSCGKVMRLARTIPAIGAVPELRTYDCNACGIVFAEGAGPAEWRES
jgi:hypothetical protein